MTFFELVKMLFSKNLIKLLIYDGKPYIPKEDVQLDEKIVEHVINNEVFIYDEYFDLQSVDLEYYSEWLLNWENNIKNYLNKVKNYFLNYTMLRHWNDENAKLMFANVKLDVVGYSLSDVYSRISEDGNFISYPIKSDIKFKYSVKELRGILKVMKNAALSKETQKILQKIVDRNVDSEKYYIVKYYKDKELFELFKLYFATSLWIIHFVRYWNGPGYEVLNKKWDVFNKSKTNIFSRNPIVTYMVNYFFNIQDKITKKIEIFDAQNIENNKNFLTRDWESYIHLLSGPTEKDILDDNLEILVGKSKLFNKNTLSGVIKSFFYNNYCMGFSGAEAGNMQYTVAYYLELATFLSNKDLKNLDENTTNIKNKITTEQVTEGVNKLLDETKITICNQLIKNYNKS